MRSNVSGHPPPQLERHDVDCNIKHDTFNTLLEEDVVASATFDGDIDFLCLPVHMTPFVGHCQDG